MSNRNHLSDLFDKFQRRLFYLSCFHSFRYFPLPPWNTSLKQIRKVLTSTNPSGTYTYGAPLWGRALTKNSPKNLLSDWLLVNLVSVCVLTWSHEALGCYVHNGWLPVSVFYQWLDKIMNLEKDGQMCPIMLLFVRASNPMSQSVETWFWSAAPRIHGRCRLRSAKFQLLISLLREPSPIQ